MSTFAPEIKLKIPAGRRVRVAVVSTLWNSHIVGRLSEGAHSTLLEAGVAEEDIVHVRVPGAVELTYAAARLVHSRTVDAVVMLGCVIRGDTPHFDYVCDSVTQGMTALNLLGTVPVTFGLVTVNTEAQAHDRAGGVVGNKGAEAAEAAVAMLLLEI